MFGSDGSPIIQYVVIFAVIFTALAAIVFVVRRLTGRGLALPGRGNGRGRQPRLGIVDVYELDRARQLILLRRDNVEHLLLVGGPNDVVIERNIQRGQRPLPEAGLRPEPLTAPIAEPLPDPLAGAGRLPQPPRSLPDGADRRAEAPFAPGFAMPVVVPSPVPRSGAAPPVTLPLDAGLLAGDEPGQDIPAPRRAPAPDLRPPAPTTARPASAVREPFFARRILGRATNPAVDPGTGQAAGREPVDAPPIPGPDAAPAVPSTAPPLAAPAPRRDVDPVILSDMARQLQAALARPASAVTPAPAVSEPDPVPAALEPAAVAPPSPEPPATAPSSGVDPMAAAMAASVPASTAAADAPQPGDVPPVQDAAPPRSDPPPEPSLPPAPPQAEPALAPSAAEPEPSGDPEPKSAGNPFSVEEIEAEFARLLGRPLDKRG